MMCSVFLAIFVIYCVYVKAARCGRLITAELKQTITGCHLVANTNLPLVLSCYYTETRRSVSFNWVI